jgi:ATP-dependent helicase/nuclease subunit A
MTFDQYAASDPEISAWVSASAGTGKTKVLTDRVLRLLLAGVSPDKILCITYTKAASAEMEQRIESQLGRWAIITDEALYEELKSLTGKAPDKALQARARQLFVRVLDAPQRLRIQTIHGFCQSVLMRFPLEAGISPHFTLIDEYTSQDLLREAQMSLFTRSRNGGKDSCAEAIAELGTLISESMLSELLKNIVYMRRRFSLWFEDIQGVEHLRQHICRVLGVEPGISVQTLLSRHMRYTQDEYTSLRRVCDALLQSEGVSDTVLGERLQRWLEKQEDYEGYIGAFITQKGEPRKLLGTKSAQKLFPAIKEILLAEQKRVLAFADELRSLKIAETSLHVVSLAQALLTLYRQQKDQRGYMDYDDLITYTVRLLHGDGIAQWVLYKLDGGIDHLLVDEAQDTSPEQWKLVEVLASEFFAGVGARQVHRTLFVVGDEKQSIFSFQGADPRQFDLMQRKLSQRIEGAGEAFKRVRLALSFRSTAAVLEAVDTVFAQANARDGLVYTENIIAHEVHRKGVAGRVEIWPLAEVTQPESHSPWHIAERLHQLPSAMQVNINGIADTIAAWLKQKRVLPSQGRSVAPGDIFILLQRRGAFADALLRTLKRRNIPVAGADRLVLTEHIGVMDCLALARFLLLPQDDLTLATVLKSPFVGLSEEELFTLAYKRGEQTLWQRLRSDVAFAFASDFLADLLSKADYLSPFALFAYVLESCHGRIKLAGRLGVEVEDPLDEFLSLAMEYERIHVPSLQGFVQWLEAENTEIKRDVQKSRDEVRIMTVHAAKGLQAPIVFLADTTRLPPAQHSDRPLWTQQEQPVPLWSPSVDYDDRHLSQLREHYRTQAGREYRRLLYVAMTRAEDELYICGWKGSKAVSDECWYEIIRGGTKEWMEEDGKRILALSQRIKPALPPSITRTEESVSLPSWAQTPAPVGPVLRTLTPSRTAAGELPMSNGDLYARERGILIHRLLQYLPDVESHERGFVARRIISYYGTVLAQKEQEQIESEIMRIIQHPDFAPVFSADSVAEAPVCGIIQDTIGNKTVISGQIDRMAVCGDDVYIIDYKTSSKVPQAEHEIPPAYLRQMQAYYQLVREIYPNKAVHCALLWTAEPRLMRLSGELLGHRLDVGAAVA